jgi:hypothetical protein
MVKFGAIARKLLPPSMRWKARLAALSDEQLRGKTDEFRAQIAEGKTVDDCWCRPSPSPARAPSARWAAALRRPADRRHGAA